MEAIFDSEKTGRAKLRVSPVRGTYEDSHAVTHLLMVPASCEHYLPGELARFLYFSLSLPNLCQTF